MSKRMLKALRHSMRWSISSRSLFKFLRATFFINEGVKSMAKNNRKVSLQEQKINKEIGARLKLRRVKLGLSQQVLADFLGVTFQQIQKYENGTNRLSVAKIQMICEYLMVSLEYFFGDKIFRDSPLLAEEKEVIDGYYALKSEDKRTVKRLLGLMKAG